MERIDKLYRHPLYQENLRQLLEEEKDRVFCRHDLSHFLDVARLMYIFSLEDGQDIPQPLLYAAALLHDMGRARQYRDGVEHHLAGGELACRILPDCDFSPEDTERIVRAIQEHRGGEGGDLLSLYLYRADKISRTCYSCQAAGDCYWSAEKKNQIIRY